MGVYCCLQTQGHPLPLKMKARGDRTEVHLLGMVKSGGDGAIHLHRHGDVTEVHPQGNTKPMFMFDTKLIRCWYQTKIACDTLSLH